MYQISSPWCEKENNRKILQEPQKATGLHDTDPSELSETDFRQMKWQPSFFYLMHIWQRTPQHQCHSVWTRRAERYDFCDISEHDRFGGVSVMAEEAFVWSLDLLVISSRTLTAVRCWNEILSVCICSQNVGYRMVKVLMSLTALHVLLTWKYNQRLPATSLMPC